MTSASDEKWRLLNWFFSRVGLRTYQHPCIIRLEGKVQRVMSSNRIKGFRNWLTVNWNSRQRCAACRHATTVSVNIECELSHKIMSLLYRGADKSLARPDWKNNWKVTIERSSFFFRRGGHCCRGDLVGRTTFWIFLSGLQKLEFGRCSLFPSWSGQWLISTSVTRKGSVDNNPPPFLFMVRCLIRHRDNLLRMAINNYQLTKR